jgi:DNA-binding PadR family transcriptional regulator
MPAKPVICRYLTYRMVTYMDDVLSRLPLREPTFFILLGLSPGPKHGYAILKEVEAWREGRLRLSTGTLYGAIKRLLDDGWIRRVEDPLPNGTERERKAYALTEKGRRVLNAEIDRLRRLLTVVQAQAAEETP